MPALMPPDLQQYRAYLAYRERDDLQEPPTSLRELIETRPTWEATSEFGLMQTHGRTLELSGSSALEWDETCIAATIQRLRERLPGIDPRLVDLPETALRLWLYGLLQRYRERGALEHTYLYPYARQGFWGKYPFGRAIPGREVYPPMTHQPCPLVTQPHDPHEHILSPTRQGQAPWPIVWARRALQMPQVEETSLLDHIQQLLQVGVTAGLFKRLHQDGTRTFYVIVAAAAILYPGGVHLLCSESERPLVRPPREALLWGGLKSGIRRASWTLHRTALHPTSALLPGPLSQGGAATRGRARTHAVAQHR